MLKLSKIVFFYFSILSAHAQNVDSIFGVYTYDSGHDTYLNNLVINEDSSFYFNTIGCFNDEETAGKWKIKNGRLILNSYDRLKDTLIILMLGSSSDLRIKGFKLEFFDTNKVAHQNVKVRFFKQNEVVDSCLTDKSGICTTTFENITSYEIELQNLPKRKILVSSINKRLINYEKIELIKKPELFFANKVFLITPEGLKGDSEFPYLFERFIYSQD